MSNLSSSCVQARLTRVVSVAGHSEPPIPNIATRDLPTILTPDEAVELADMLVRAAGDAKEMAERLAEANAKALASAKRGTSKIRAGRGRK